MAKELTVQGTQLVVHTVGFDVDERSRRQLTCIAQVTGGTYSDAPDGKTLERILPRVSATALRTYEPAGTPITGTPAWTNAPVVDPGQHLDTLGGHETRYYALDVPEGGTAHFSGTVSFPLVHGVSRTQDFNTLQLRVYGEGGKDCHVFESEQAGLSSDGVALTVARTLDGKDGSCRGGGRYYFALTWDRVSTGVPERLPVELLALVEPPVADPGPDTVLPPVTPVEPSGTRETTGGGSFNVAATLPGSGRYTDTLQRGEYVFYRVKLDWGQGLAYRVHFGQAGGTGVDNVSNIATTLYNPYRAEIGSDTTVFTGTPHTLPTGRDAVATVPVRYHNRDADDSSVRGQAVAGWYYLAVKMGATAAAGDDVPVPVTLDVTVGGQREDGPSYAGAATAPAPAAPALTAIAGEPATWPIWVGVGAAAVVVLAGVVILLARRRA
ncbi:hypothetical protein [Amycolatopsis viridis]|uniref:Ca-activated chloride channel family protein n=1 Tax=Amycolatopsis viridis TaxID=185678 RepID=A0ABX0T1D4_9PSEU|nr:hypothetical protein [Amycolatopsis viridis]NIH82558.1 Ca-activated chloride channel family protein [Amycolatopsis viridis]